MFFIKTQKKIENNLTFSCLIWEAGFHFLSDIEQHMHMFQVNWSEETPETFPKVQENDI